MQIGGERLTLGGLVGTFHFLEPKDQCLFLGAEFSLYDSELLRSFEPHARLMQSLDPFKVFHRCGKGNPLQLVELIKATGATPKMEVTKIDDILTKYSPAVRALLSHTFDFCDGGEDDDEDTCEEEDDEKEMPRTVFAKITGVSAFTHQGKETDEFHEDEPAVYDLMGGAYRHFDMGGGYRHGFDVRSGKADIEATFSGRFSSSERSSDTATFTLRFKYSESYHIEDCEGGRSKSFTAKLDLLTIEPASFLSAEEKKILCRGSQNVSGTFLGLLELFRTKYVIPHSKTPHNVLRYDLVDDQFDGYHDLGDDYLYEY